MKQARTFNIWPWLPVIVLGTTAIPSLIFVMLAHSMRLGLVEGLPYQASVHYDADKQARLAFAGSGYHLLAESDGPLHLRFQLTAPSAAPAALRTQLALYRPDDSRCDRVVPWSDPSQTLSVIVPRPGLWRVRVDVTIVDRSEHRLLTEETSIDALPESTP